ncbi:MAG: prolyl oligopeptidase family serine peptidase [Halieaceae bacterium]|jgi:dipeptidyl aminopeptidase/acylaminoacyl peptidase|nr:prolyl oligopeptidase family serine peptidase [Halieaceae bacterium]
MKMLRVLSLLLIAMTAPALADPYPLDYWARRSAISNVSVSPDGKRLGLLKIPARGENPIIEVYNTDDLSKEPFRVNANPMEITSFQWVDDANIVMNVRQAVRDQIEGYNQGVYEYRIALIDIEKERLRRIDENAPSIVSVLPNKPGKILISFQEGGADGAGAKLDKVFRPRAYWELDLDRGSKKLLVRGKISLGNIDFDEDGNPITARGFDIASGEFIWYWRKPGESDWTEMYRWSEESEESYTLYGPDPEKPGHFLVAANNGDDKIGLWSFDAENKRFDELVYRRNDVDISSVRNHSNRWAHPDEAAGVVWVKDKVHVEWFNPEEGALMQQLEQIIPNAHYVSITSRSRDGNTLAVRNLGPRDPGTYYLIHQGKMQVIGGNKPYLEAEQLADVEYITYPARDGREIPAYLTIPNGEPPFPLVVLPHGGPFVSEVILYDEWSQMLANNGYLVVQPQYRGSQGHGLEHYMSAFENNSQGGYKMQDDKDDAIDYLVKRGLTTKDNVAMFGWSYGGYAALVAAGRTPQPYQCVVAGAAVGDPQVQMNFFSRRTRGFTKNVFVPFWENALSPVKRYEDVNVPVLLIHGDVDQRVPLQSINEYRDNLEESGKDFKWVLLEGADHFSNTLFYDHKLTIYSEILSFLNGKCGLKGGTNYQTASR